MTSIAPVKIWIFRKGNGQLRVHPSPVVLSRGEVFRIKNLATADATASFPADIVEDAARVGIAAGGASQDLRVVAARSVYFEYDVTVGGDYADGGSKPGGIVDP